MNSYPSLIPIDAHGGGLGFLITQARNVLLAAIENELAPLGVSAAQFIVVLAVAHGRASTPSAFARLVGCDSGAMTRLLDRIERKGILRRCRDRGDRRIVQVELTDRGEALHPLIMASVGRVQARMLQLFSAAELSQFELLLQRFIGTAEENFLCLFLPRQIPQAERKHETVDFCTRPAWRAQRQGPADQRSAGGLRQPGGCKDHRNT